MMNVQNLSRRLSVLLLLVASLMPFALPAQAPGQYDADQALAVSQAAIGRTLANLEFTDRQGKQVHLDDYRGKPMLISMIFTSCYHVCPALTRHLATAVEAAREVLGEDSFQVLTIGFDVAKDSPDAMRVFAREQGVTDPHWAFLSATQQNLDSLVESTGFVYFPSPRGFDHINQLTVVDRDGVVYRQVYGGAFDLPWMVEPLKELVFNQPRGAQHFVAGMADRVRLFCTVYDPATGRYRFDYSLFVQIAIGALAILGVAGWLTLEALRKRRGNRPEV